MSSEFFFDPTNLLILPAIIAGNYRYADWEGAQESYGMLGVASEIAQSAVGANTMAFFIPTSSEWKIQDVQALLFRHGIKLWGVGYWNGEMHFRVKKRQAHWAQYVMLRAGVPLLHGLMSGSRAIPGTGRPQPQLEGAERGVLFWLKDLFK